MSYTAIIAKLVRATAPSIELDEEIRIAVGAESILYGSGDERAVTDGCYGPPNYTGEFEDALRLVPDDYYMMVERYSDGWYAEVARVSGLPRSKGQQKPLAIAVCIAAFKDMEARQS